MQNGDILLFIFWILFGYFHFLLDLGFVEWMKYAVILRSATIFICDNIHQVVYYFSFLMALDLNSIVPLSNCVSVPRCHLFILRT